VSKTPKPSSPKYLKKDPSQWAAFKFSFSVPVNGHRETCEAATKKLSENLRGFGLEDERMELWTRGVAEGGGRERNKVRQKSGAGPQHKTTRPKRGVKTAPQRMFFRD